MRKVSIIVLTYNNIESLDRALASISNQSYDNIEVLISDDGSTKVTEDDICKVAASYKNSLDIHVHVNEKNMGTVRNFNGAIRRSTGEYIFPLSCDDEFVDGNAVAEIVDTMESENYEICTAYRKGKNTGAILPAEDEASILETVDRDLLLARLAVGNIVCGATLYYRRTVFDKYGFFDEKYDLLEDYPYIFAFLKKGGCLGWLDKVTILYGESGVSSKVENRPPNPRLKKDAIIMHEEDVITSAEYINNKRIKRYVDYRRKKHEGKIPRFILKIQYIDLSLLKLKKILKKDKRSMFWTLYKMPKK